MQRQRLLTSIYSASFFFTLHYAFLLYISSSYLGQFFDAPTAGRAVSLIYVIASLVTIFAISKTPILFKNFGLAHTTYGLLWLAAVSCLCLAMSPAALLAIPLFIVLFASQLVLRYVLDIYIEKFSSDQVTGQIRGIFLTVINIAIALSPFLVGQIISKSGFPLVYLMAGLLIIMAITTTLGKLSHVHDDLYHTADIVKTTHKVLRRKDLYHIFSVNFILETFYAWMVIYTPLYLLDLGFNWSDIGIIFSLMLIPFILIEIPAGHLADEKYGEKEMLTMGLIIMGLATIGVAYLQSIPGTCIFTPLESVQTWMYGVPVLQLPCAALPWALILFATRIGAAFIEIMTDTYFFKKVHSDDTDIIGLFRSAKPIATIVAPLVATIILAMGSYQTLYLILGLLALYGVRHSLAIHDTK